MNVQVLEQSQDWKQCCDIIDRLVDIGDCNVLGDCILMCCSNSEEVMNCVIGQYSGVLNRDE